MEGRRNRCHDTPSSGASTFKHVHMRSLSARWSLRAVVTLQLFTVLNCASVAKQDSSHEAVSRYVRGDTKSENVVVFVHGVFGDAVSTWTNPMTKAYWPELLTKDAAFDGVDVFVHSFPSPVLQRSYTVDELADQLRLRLNANNVFEHHKHVIFLCHSMGGLVVRAFLLKYRQHAGQVPMIYFFSTPTTGSGIANLARFISANPQLTDMRKMTTDDPGTLGVWQSQWVSSEYNKTDSYCAYELRQTHGMQVVERESGTALCNKSYDPMDRDHIGMVKPSNQNDAPYVAFKEAYRQSAADERSEKPWEPVSVRVVDNSGEAVIVDAVWHDIHWAGAKGWLCGSREEQGGSGWFIGRGILLYTENSGETWQDITANVEFDSGSFAHWPQTWKGVGPIVAVDVYISRDETGLRHLEGWLVSHTGIYTTPDAISGKWQRMTPSPALPGGYAHFQRATYIEAYREIYAAGWQGIAHWQRGGQWEVQLGTYTYLIEGVFAFGDTQRDVWAAGRAGSDEYGKIDSDSRGAIYHLDWLRNEWKQVSTGIKLQIGQAFTDIMQIGYETVVAVGYQGLVIRGVKDGESWTWTRRDSGATEHLITITADGRTLWAVGSKGTIIRSEDDGNTWQAVPSGSQARLIRMRPSEKFLWIMGDHVLLRRAR